MSRDAIIGFLQMMLNLRGQIALLECDMRVVMKTGRAGALVPTVELSTHESTPREMIEAAKTAAPLELPEVAPGALDQAEPTIHQAGFTESPPTSTAGATTAAANSAGQREPGASGQPAVDDLHDILLTNVAAQVRFLGPEHKTRLKALCEHYGVAPKSSGLADAWGHRAEDLPRLIDELESDMNAEAQETLEGVVEEDDAIPF